MEGDLVTFSFFYSKTFKKQVIADPHLSYKCNAEKFESGGLLDKCINFSGESLYFFVHYIF